jgi:hypothetical protein
MRLVRKELIHPAASTLAGDRAFRFRHLLIRDAAYDALSKETRAELHERFADWLETRGQGLIELDEVLGYHLEQAARYRRELDRPEVDLERRAGRRLAAAGSKAALRSDAHGAANLLRRALALLPRDPRRPAAIIDQLAILEDLGKTEERLTLIEELEGATDAALRMHGHVARLGLRTNDRTGRSSGRSGGRRPEGARALHRDERRPRRGAGLLPHRLDELGPQPSGPHNGSARATNRARATGRRTCPRRPGNAGTDRTVHLRTLRAARDPSAPRTATDGRVAARDRERALRGGGTRPPREAFRRRARSAATVELDRARARSRRPEARSTRSGGPRSCATRGVSTMRS